MVYPKSNQKALNAYYGICGTKDAKGNWVQTRLFAQNLVPFAPPYQMVTGVDLPAGKIGYVPIKRLLVHPKLHADFTSIFKEIFALYGNDYEKVKEANMHKTGGTHCFRTIRGSKDTLSTHSWAISIDLDVENNGLGNKSPKMPKEVIAIFKNHGWTWGGDFSRCDGMHFEATSG